MQKFDVFHCVIMPFVLVTCDMYSYVKTMEVELLMSVIYLIFFLCRCLLVFDGYSLVSKFTKM